MKYLNCYFLFFCLCTAQIIAQSLPRFAGGDQAYVWARSGLNMRPHPGTDSAPIKQLPLGTQLRVLDFDPYDLFRYVDSIPVDDCGGDSEAQSYALSGYWMPVLAGQDTGYVFSGYLGRYLPPQPSNKGQRETFMSFAKRVFGEPNVLVKPNPKHGESLIDQVYARYAFPNGVLYDMNYRFGNDEQIVLPGTRLSEAYLLMNLLTHFDALHFSDGYEEQLHSSLCWDESGKLSMEIDLMQIELVEMGNLVIVSVHVDGC